MFEHLPQLQIRGFSYVLTRLSRKRTDQRLNLKPDAQRPLANDMNVYLETSLSKELGCRVTRRSDSSGVGCVGPLLSSHFEAVILDVKIEHWIRLTVQLEELSIAS